MATSFSFDQPRSKMLARYLSFLGLGLFFIASARADTTYVYLESNIGKIPNQNSILAYKNDGAGNLTAVSGSPYLTGGTGVYDPTSGPIEFDADQQVTASPDGTRLYAVEGHSNTIAAFMVNADGTLTTIAGSPFSSGGHDPVSIGFLASPISQLVVANKNEDPNQDNSGTLPNYTTFTVNGDGSLTLNSGSTLDLAFGSSPSQSLIQTRGRLHFGLEFATSRIVSYRLRRNGLMVELSSVMPSITGDRFLGETLHPNKRILYAGLPLSNGLAVYSYNTAGILSPVTTVPNTGTLICWVTVNAAGTVLYSAETGSGTVSAYDLTDARAPVLVQHFQLVGTGNKPSNLAIDPTQQFLYVLSGLKLHVLNLDASGLMSETATPVTLPVPSDEVPLGLAVIRK